MQPPQPGEAPQKPRRRHRVLKRILWSVAGLIAFIVILLTSFTAYLSSGHLARLISTRCSEYFYADFDVRQCDFTFWSSFPRFYLEVDSLNIVSRTLRDARLSKQQRDSLPANADSLLFLRRLRGSVNVLKLIAGKVELNNVDVDGIRLNLVTLNDSVNNFNITPAHPDMRFKIPYTSADKIELRNLYDFTFYSAPDRLKASTSFRAATLTRKPHTDVYHLALKGNLNSDFGDIRVCRNLPFLFNGDINFRFNPFRLSMNRMGVQLANTVSHITMDMDLGDNPRIEDLRTEVSTFDIVKLLEYLPAEFVPDLQRVRTDLRTGISIHLLGPWKFSSGKLPSFVAELTVPDSKVTYTLDTGQTYTVSDINLRASLTFNGDDWRTSFIDISRFTAAGEGLSLLLSGRIADVFADPRFSAALKLSVDASHIAEVIPSMRKFDLRGSGEVQAKVGEFSLSTIDEHRYMHIPLTGDVAVKNFAISLPDGTELSSGKVGLRFDNGHSAPLYAVADLGDIEVHRADGTRVSTPGLHATAVRLDDDRFLAKGTIGNISADMPAKGISANASGLSVTYPLYGDFSSPQIAAESLTLPFGKGNLFKINNLTADIAGFSNYKFGAGKAVLSLPDNKNVAAKGMRVNTRDFRSFDVSLAAGEYSMPDPTDTIPNAHLLTAAVRRLSGNFSLEGGKLLAAALDLPDATVNTSAYPEPIRITHLRASTDALRSFRLASIGVRSGLTAFDLAGTLDILQRDSRPFYRINAQLDIDTLHFNQMAQIFESGTAYRPSEDTESETPHSAFIVPANMEVNVNACADATVYTNLWLTDLGANFRMSPGKMSVDTLFLSANFGHAGASLKYAGADVDSLRLSLAAKVADFNLTEFFRSYPNVLALMPEMGNLHGIFDANATCSMRLFPSMDIDTKSLVADVNAAATHLYLTQNPFIRHIARMALIFRKGDIFIPSIHASARVFDHLLEVFPFDIYIGDYHLSALGRNDFSGNLYYHVDVLRNPLLPIKFGINVEGKYHHPKLRFSSSKFDVRKSEDISGIDVTDTINIIDQARHYGWLLIHHAAQAERDGVKQIH